MTIEELAREVRILKDINAIKDITTEYWLSIDTKDPDRLRDVFAPGEISISFDDMPTWRSRDHFAKSFAKFAMPEWRLENHFGLNPRIEVSSETTASGRWRHIMFGFNFDQRTVMRVTGDYEIDYVRHDGSWKILSLEFKRHSFFSANVMPDGNLNSSGFGPDSASRFKELFAG